MVIIYNYGGLSNFNLCLYLIDFCLWRVTDCFYGPFCCVEYEQAHEHKFSFFLNKEKSIFWKGLKIILNSFSYIMKDLPQMIFHNK